jgi:hypothetical protein
MADVKRNTNPPTDHGANPAPSIEYTNEIAEMICGRLVEDETLRSICSEPGMPDLATVASWLSNNQEFRDEYALAREFQAYEIAYETIKLADEISTESPEKVCANGRVVRVRDRKNFPRYRLRLDVRHWVADQLLARARQLSARTLFPDLSDPFSEILQDPSVDFSRTTKGNTP